MELTAYDLRRARYYITRPDLCTLPGCIEWVEALLDEIDRLRALTDDDVDTTLIVHNPPRN